LRRSILAPRHMSVPDGLLDMAGLARAAALHPDLVSRLYCLGLFDAATVRFEEPLFSEGTTLRLRRMARLHTDLCIPWSALALIMDLLERVDELEARNRE
jgi:chaperone modulatory protein CbpM